MNRRRTGKHPFIFFALILAITILVSLIVSSPWFPPAGLAFAVLVVSAFFLDITRVLFLSLASIFILNWNPGFDPRVLVFVGLPLLVWLITRSLSWKIWTKVLVAVIVAPLLLYAALLLPWEGSTWRLVPRVVFTQAVFSVVLFSLFSRIYAPHPTR